MLSESDIGLLERCAEYITTLQRIIDTLYVHVFDVPTLENLIDELQRGIEQLQDEAKIEPSPFLGKLVMKEGVYRDSLRNCST